MSEPSGLNFEAHPGLGEPPQDEDGIEESGQLLRRRLAANVDAR
jgi:hypothetical protein